MTVDGETIVTWTLDRSRGVPIIEVEPFETLDAATEAGIEAEVTDIGRFIDTEVEWRPTK